MILSGQSIAYYSRTSVEYPVAVDPPGRRNETGCCWNLSEPLISPFVHRCAHGNGTSYGLSSASYDVRLGDGFRWVGPMPPARPSDLFRGPVRLYRGDMVLAATLERFRLPSWLAMHVRDKSSLVRQGLTVQNTHCDPGWRGFLTLELVNHGPQPFTLVPGMPIAQVVFEVLDEPTHFPYDGKYQDQEEGPQVARMERRTLVVEDSEETRG